MVTCYSETPHNDMVRIMIQSGADKYKGQWTTTALMDTYWMKVLQWIHKMGMVLLHSASWSGYSYQLWSWCQQTIAKDTNTTALMIACNYQRTVCVDLLLAGGADPNQCGIENSHLSLLPAYYRSWLIQCIKMSRECNGRASVFSS